MAANLDAPTDWTRTKAVASPAEMTRPTAGTPCDESRPKTDGNTRSVAAAIGTWPIISVQPLSAPSDDTITAKATTLAAQAPHIRRAASANGADDTTSCSGDTTPMTTAVPSTYSPPATRIPSIVERGIVRSGSCTSPAGTVADSRPRYANMVSGASAAL